MYVVDGQNILQDIVDENDLKKKKNTYAMDMILKYTNKLSEDMEIIYNRIKKIELRNTAVHITTVGTTYTPGYLQQKLSKEEEYMCYGYSAGTQQVKRRRSNY